MKEDHKKAFKKLTLFSFRTQSLLMDKVIKIKRGLELVTSHSSCHETSLEKLLYFLYFSISLVFVLLTTTLTWNTIYFMPYETVSISLGFLKDFFVFPLFFGITNYRKILLIRPISNIHPTKCNSINIPNIALPPRPPPLLKRKRYIYIF